MGEARVAVDGRSGPRLRGAPQGRVEFVAQLSQLVGNRAMSQIIAQRQAWPLIVNRKPIDQLAKNNSFDAVDRCRQYARIAEAQKVGIDPDKVHVSTYIQPGLNLHSFPADITTSATVKWIDENNATIDGAPPPKVKGIAMIVNSNSIHFKDADYMVAAIRHEMVHFRLSKRTLEHRTAWQKTTSKLSFSQYVDKQVKGVDQALVKGRYFGHSLGEETIAYLEGFLTAYEYSEVEPPGAVKPSQYGDPAWIRHLKGFTKYYHTAWLNDKPLSPKDLKRLNEQQVASALSVTAAVKESTKRVKDYCKGLDGTRRANLAAWMQHLSGILPEGHGAALKMIYKAAAGKALSTPAAKTTPRSKP